MPAGGEELARKFYGGLLGLDEVEKPSDLRGRGGCWFQSDGLKVHLGVEANFRPAQKAHPALRASEFGALFDRLRAAGCPISEDGPFEGAARAYVDDPFGNRIELIEES